MVHDHWGLPEECGPCFFNPNHDPKTGRFAGKRGGGGGGGKRKKKRAKQRKSAAGTIGSSIVTGFKAGAIVGGIAGAGLAAGALANYAGSARAAHSFVSASRAARGVGSFKKYAGGTVRTSHLIGAASLTGGAILRGATAGAQIGGLVGIGTVGYRGSKSVYKKIKRKKGKKSRRVKIG